MLKLPTIESLVGLLKQLAAPNDDILNTTLQRRSEYQEYASEEDGENACLNYINRARDKFEKVSAFSPVDIVNFKVRLHDLTKALAGAAPDRHGTV